MRVLHVEDTLIAQKMVEMIIFEKFSSAQIVAAGTLAEAKKQLNESTFDLILLDYLLEDGSGLEIIEEAKETPIIMITGGGNENIAVKAMKLGAYDYLVKDSKENFIRMLPKTIEGVLARKQTEKTLEDTKQMYKMMIQEARDAIFICDGNTRLFINANKQALDMIGKARQEIVKMHIKDLFPPEKADYFFNLLEDNLFHKKEILEDLCLLNKEGKETPVSVTISQAKLSDKTIFQYVFRDITQRKQMEMQLNHAQKMESVGQLAAGIAHEINTPLQFIGNNTRFLQNSFDDLIEIFNEYSQLIEKSKDRFSPEELIQQLISKVKTNDMEILVDEIPEAINDSLGGIERVGKIVQAMKEFSHPGVEEKKLSNINEAIKTVLNISQYEWKNVANVEMELDPDLPLVPCYINDFNQAILNIIVNASQAIEDSLESETSQKGIINIMTKQNNKWAEIRITDSGNGIPDAIRHKIYDHFFTTKELGKGTGQGLALAHAMIVKKHHGKILLESEMGQGTTFTICLPLENSF